MANYSALDLTKSLNREDDVDQYVAAFGADVADKRPFLNIGSGKWSHPVWRTLDQTEPPYDQYGEPDYNIDLMKMEPWPIEDGSMQILYTIHMMEHVPDAVDAHVMREAHRILAPGGIFRVVVPDIINAYWAFKLGDLHYFDEQYASRAKGSQIQYASSGGHSHGWSVETAFLVYFAGGMGHTRKGRPPEEIDAEVRAVFARLPLEDALAHFLKGSETTRRRPSTHINWWSEGKLTRMLNEAGFNTVIRNSYGQSICPLLRNKIYFDQSRPNLALYVDAVRA